MYNFLKLATFNIRYSPLNSVNYHNNQLYLSGNGEAPWSIRLPLIINQIEWEKPDIIGFQEVLQHQYQDLKDQLTCSQYKSVGVGRDDGIKRGEFIPIFWRSDKFKSLDVKHFWLSDFPHVPGSIGWDAGQTRMVTLVHFQPISTNNNQDQSFYVMNTHFDDRGLKSRTESAKLILKRSNELVNEMGKPIILMGDFNAPRTEEGYKVLTGYEKTTEICSIKEIEIKLEVNEKMKLFKDCRDEAKIKYGAIDATFTGFDNNPKVAQIIDYLLILRPTNKVWKTIHYGVIPNQFFYNQPIASDHRLVCAIIDTTS